MTRIALVEAVSGVPVIPIDAADPDALPAAFSELTPAARRYAEAAGFKAGAGTTLLVPGGSGGVDRILFGLGKAGSTERVPLLAGRLGTALPPGAYRLGDGFDDRSLAALAIANGGYRFRRYRAAGDEDGVVRLVVPEGADAAELTRIVAATTLARDLINTPANDMGPADLANAVIAAAKPHGATVEVTIGDDLATGFPLIHGVGAAATDARAPRLIDLRWGDPAAPRITLVGKGVVFDTGGLDLKPSSNMLLMKKDMGGAANALALATLIMGANLKVRLRLLIPAVENAVSGASFRPGDILRSRRGLSVEIGNTDAEGRLILADALDLASEEEPELLLDFATLTGAARVALGPELPAVFTGGDALAAELAGHAADVADPLWRLPLWRPYLSMLDSKVADINNAGSGGFAGAITAALFLSRFVTNPERWVHTDLFAWVPSAKPGQPEGGEAQTIRAFYALLKARYAR
ncbi:MAG: M17 family metallopeptidase [Bauldia sp.]